MSAIDGIDNAYRVFKKNGGTSKQWVDELIELLVRPFLAAERQAWEPIPTLKLLAPKPQTFLPPAVNRPKIGRSHTNVKKFRQSARIAAGIVFYNEARLLRRCLDSLREFDLVICIDGVYDLAQGSPLSTDGSRDIIQSYDNTLLVDMPYHRQTEVRNHYLEEAVWNHCDYILVFEADEYLTGDVKEFRENLPVHDLTGIKDVVYNVPMHYVGQNHIVKSPRFFYKPELIRYGGSHSTYIVDGVAWLVRNGNESNVFENLPGIVVNHDEGPRTKEQELRSEDYKEKLIVQEKVERHALSKAGKIL